jgi:hypothetical protein
VVDGPTDWHPNGPSQNSTRSKVYSILFDDQPGNIVENVRDIFVRSPPAIQTQQQLTKKMREQLRHTFTKPEKEVRLDEYY